MENNFEWWELQAIFFADFCNTESTFCYVRGYFHSRKMFQKHFERRQRNKNCWIRGVAPPTSVYFTNKEAKVVYYTVKKHDGHLRTRGKYRKYEPQASVRFLHISRVFSNVTVFDQWKRAQGPIYIDCYLVNVQV